MAITYFGSASTPADNTTGSVAPGPKTITQPASMTTGQLVIVILHCRTGLSVTTSVSTTGGQTWTQENTQTVVSNVGTLSVYSCTFNGTWAASPAFSISGSTVSFSCIMHVFTPNASTSTWAIDVAQVNGAQTASTAHSITGITTLSANTVTLAGWSNNNTTPTWSTLTGTGWAVTGTAQYRNASSGSQVDAFAHNIQASAATLANVSNTASSSIAIGTFIFAMKEVAGVVAIPSKIFQINQSVNRSANY